MERLFNEKVTLVKRDGSRKGGLRAVVDRGQILTVDVDAPIVEGDRVERTLPNGQVEVHSVMEAVYRESFEGLPAHYELRVEKPSAPGRARTTEVIAHDAQIFRKADALLSEKQLVELLGRLQRDHSHQDSQTRRVVDLCEFFVLEGNQFLLDPLRDTSGGLVEALRTLLEFIGLTYFVCPKEQAGGSDWRYCLDPEASVKRARRYPDEEWRKRYSESATEQDRLCDRAREAYKAYRRVTKTELLVSSSESATAALEWPRSEEIAGICAAGESQLHEFKEPSVDTGKLCKEIAAFLNTKRGGIIFVGINDDGDVLGTDQKLADVDQRLQSGINDSIEPGATVSVDSVIVRSKTVLMIRVPPWDRESVYQHKGRVYIRKGTTVQVAKPDEQRKLHQGLPVA